MFVNPADKSVDALEQEIKDLENKHLDKSSTDIEDDQPKGGDPEVSEAPKKRARPLVDEEGSQVSPKKDSSDEDTDWKKRFGDLRRHSQKVENDLKKEIDALKTASKKIDPPTDPEEVKAWVAKYPQVAAIISAIADERTDTKLADKAISNKLKEIEEVSQQLLRDKELARINKAHPDFDEITSDADFHTWVKRSKRLEDAVYEGDADDVIWAIGLYKESLTPAVREDLEIARAAPKGSRTEPAATGRGRRFTESEVDAMSTDEYQKNEEAIMASMKSGKFVYDLSDGAR